MRHDQSPDWRWLRAQALADAGKMPRRDGDDRYVKKAYKFLMQMRRNDRKSEVRLQNHYPALFHAFRIYETTSTPIRWLLEAGIVADEPAESLALYLNTDEAVITAFERTFFDVRDALANRGCIVANVIGHAFMSDRIPPSPDTLWKALALDGGWAVVQCLFETGRADPAVIDYVRRTYRQTALLNGLLSTKTIRNTEHNSAERERLALDLIRQEEELGPTGGGDIAHNAMGGLLRSIKLSVTPSGSEQLAEEPRLQSFSLPAPRAIEVEQVEEKKGKKK